MEEKELKQKCLKLMQSANAIYFGTIGKDGFPHIRMMSNLRNEEENPGLVEILKQHKDDFVVYLITRKSSTKVQQIKTNPKVSVYLCNPPESHTLMLSGEIKEITETQFKRQLWQKGWEMFWPGGADDPEFTVLMLKPVFAKGGYKEVLFEFKIK